MKRETERKRFRVKCSDEVLLSVMFREGKIKTKTENGGKRRTYKVESPE